MKQLKFNHSFAKLIRTGGKTATLRMYDDKDLAVNDRVELLDKIDPSRPATWKSIGAARIDSIIEKRFSEISESDLRETEKYGSRDEMLATYRTYYGPQVTSDMPIKVIRFTLLPNSELLVNSDDKRTTILNNFSLYADGGSRGNPGPSAAGYVIISTNDEVLDKRGVYLGVTTNNQAEYTALKLGLEELQKMKARRVHVYMDSLLVINQMLGIFKVKNRDLWPIHDMVKQQSATFEHISFTHVPRTMNKLADAAVNEALDEAAKGSI